MEATFALKTLHKKVIIVYVGVDDEKKEEWRNSTVGMLVLQNYELELDLSTNASEETFKTVTEELGAHLCKRFAVKIKEEGGDDEIKEEVAAKAEPLETKAPILGDDVITHWNGTWQYFGSTIVDFDGEEMTYTVDWKDGDTTGRVSKYDQVAKDVVPDPIDIGDGTLCLFEQGKYALDGVEGYRWHLGRITAITVDEETGEKLYSGEHAKGEDDGKWVTYRGYEAEFFEYPIGRLRTFPTAFEALSAFKLL